MKTDWEITQEAKTLPVLHNPLMIEGLPGIGNVGKITADYLVEELDATLLYSFFTYKFPHSVFVNEKNLVEMPKLEMYYKKFNSKTKRDLLILVGDIQPIDEESCFSFCDEVIKIAKHFKCSEIITTGGIGLQQQIPEKPKVYCTANDSKLLKEYLHKDLQVEKDIFGVVGPIVGVSGILLGLGKKRNMKGVALLAETFGHPLYLGIKGAKEIIRVIDTKFKYNIDLKKMSKEITEVEKEIMKKTHDWIAEVNQAQSAGAQTKKKEASYIG